MNYSDRVKDSTVTTGTGAIALSGSAPAGFQAFAAGFTNGATVPYAISDQSGSNWEVGYGTFTSPTTLARTTVLSSSNAGALVNFGAGTKDVICTAPAAFLASLPTVQTAAFSAAISLTSAGTTYLPQQTVSAVIPFTLAASPTKGSLAYVRLIADGTNLPTFTGFKEWGGSLGYDNRNGIPNIIQFFYDGTDAFFSVSQPVGATVVLTVPGTMAAPVATAGNASASVAFTAPGNGGSAITGYTVTSTPGGFTATGTASPLTVSGLTNATAYTFTAYATNAQGNGTPSPASNSVTPQPVAATAITMTGPTAGTVSVASTNFTVGVSPTGGTITGTVVVTPSDSAGGGTFTPTTVSLTTAAPTATFTYTPNATAGAKTISATNNSSAPVLTNPANITYTTSAAAGAYLRFASLVGMTESGTANPYAYTGTGTAFSSNGGLSPQSMAGDGSVSIKLTGAVNSASNERMLALTSVATTPTAYGSYECLLYTALTGTPAYSTFTAGTVTKVDSATRTPATGDIVRLRKVGTTVYGEVSKDSGSTWLLITTFSNVGAGINRCQIQLSGVATCEAGTAVGMA